MTIFASNAATYTERMVIRGDTGRVGINTDSPSQTLDVNGTLNVSGDVRYNNNAIVASYASSTNIDHIWHDDSTNSWNFCSDASYKATGNSKIVAGASSFSDRMVIRANGGDILTLEDSGGTNEAGHINFTNSNGTSLGYIGFGNNDDIHIKNDDSGGNIYIGVASRWALQIDTNGDLLPYADNQHYLGKSGRAWNHFYLHQGNTFSSGGYWTLRSRDSDRQVMEYTSSERFKKDIVDLPLSEAYQILDARVIKFRGIDDDDTVPLEAVCLPRVCTTQALSMRFVTTKGIGAKRLAASTTRCLLRRSSRFAKTCMIGSLN